jgi:hypothetical protein
MSAMTNALRALGVVVLVASLGYATDALGCPAMRFHCRDGVMEGGPQPCDIDGAQDRRCTWNASIPSVSGDTFPLTLKVRVGHRHRIFVHPSHFRSGFYYFRCRRGPHTSGG